MTTNWIDLAEKVGHALKDKGMKLVTAESCTGGWISQVVTSVSGSANWFDRGFITYSSEAKKEILGVSPHTLEQYGVVSLQTAREMAEGALQHSHATLSLSVTGIAGPTGGTEKKPVGTVCFGWSGNEIETVVECKHFEGDRYSVREQTVVYALTRLLNLLDQ